MRKLKKRKYQQGDLISPNIYTSGIGDKWELNVQNSKNAMQQQMYRQALDMYNFQSKLTDKANLYTSIGNFLKNTTNNIIKSVNESSLEDDDETTEKENQNDEIYGNGFNINAFYNSVLGNGAYGTYTSQNKKGGKIKKIRKGLNSLKTSSLFDDYFWQNIFDPGYHPQWYSDYFFNNIYNKSGNYPEWYRSLYYLSEKGNQEKFNEENASIINKYSGLNYKGNYTGSNYSGLFGRLKNAKGAYNDALDNFNAAVGNLDSNALEEAASDIDSAKSALKGEKQQLAGSIIGGVSNVANNLMGEKPLYDTKYGTLTRGLDNLYDTTIDTLGLLPGIGWAVKGFGELNSALNNGLQHLGVGTDGITKTDAILGSDWLALTPVGLINSIGAKKTHSLSWDPNASWVASSYTGSTKNWLEQKEKAGKKVGLLSNRRKINNAIDNAAEQNRIQGEIGKEAETKANLNSSMSAINSNRLTLQRNGGYKQQYASVGKNGEKLGKNLKRVQNIKKNKKKLQMGGVIEPQYKLYPKTEKIQFSVENLGGEPVYITRPTIQRPVIQQPEKSEIEKIDPRTYFPSITDDIIIPSNEEMQRKMSNDYSNIIVPSDEELAEIVENLNAKGEPRSMEELIQYAEEKNPRFILRMKEFPMILTFINDYSPTEEEGLGRTEHGSHLLSYGTDDEGNAIVHPYIMEEHEGEGDLKKYSPDEAYKLANERGDYLVMSPEEAELFTINYKKFYNKFMSVFDEMENFANEHPDMSGPAIRLLFMEKEGITSIPEYQEGGSIIPDGALHAHKHHIETEENITEKGIPVVIENKDGEIELVAEIERGEIIFTKEFTEKLENLCKLYYNKEIEQEEKENVALEAGQLLVNEILNNTEDKTGELL